MAANLPGRPPVKRAQKKDEGGIRALTAMLRWRLRWMLSRLPAEQANALRFFPAMMQASFASPPLKLEAPGIARLKFRRSWTTLARVFGLPPPSSMQRAKGAIDAVFAIPRSDGVDLFAVLATPLPPRARQAIVDRIAAAQAVLGPIGRTIDCKLVDPNTIDEPTFQAIMSLGVLLAGLPPASFFTATNPAVQTPLPIAAMLAERATTPLAALSLMLMVGEKHSPPLAVVQKGLADKISARLLSDPSVFCARWASQSPSAGALLSNVLKWTDPHAAAEDRPPPGEILRVGRELVLLCARSIHRCPIADSKALRARFRRDVISGGLPAALLPVLGQCKLRFSPAPVLVNANHEVRLTDGTVLGRGHSAIQARIRALALVTAAGYPTESKLAARIAKNTVTSTLHLIIETDESTGGQAETVNTSPERPFGVVGATALILRVGYRPTALRLNGAETVRAIAESALRNREIEVIPLMAEGQPATARLSRVVTVMQKRGSYPAAIAAGGIVLLEREGRVRQIPMRNFARRPTVCNTDPESMELSLSPERGARSSGAFAIPNAIDCRVYQVTETTACVLSRDDKGRLMREEVALNRLEDHLREGQEILRAGVPAAPLAARLSDGMEALLMRHRRTVYAMPVTIGGDLPMKMWMEIDGTRIQLSRRGGWDAAAQTILSKLPDGVEANLKITRAEITERGEQAKPISRLYARAMVLRRIAIHLRKQTGLIGR